MTGSPLTPEQEARVREIVRAEIAEAAARRRVTIGGDAEIYERCINPVLLKARSIVS